MLAYIIGSLTTLISVSVGFVFGKPYLDRWQSKRLQQVQPTKPPTPKQPTTGGLTV